MKKTLLCSLSLTLSVLSFAEPARFARAFGNGMVLQREKPVPVWGFAEPGAEVKVSFADQVRTAKADAQGRWRVTLAPLAASRQGRTLVLQSAANGTSSEQSNNPNNQTILSDILVGDVWFLGGQSNMHYGLKSTYDAPEALARADGHADFRFLFVDTEKRAETPRADLGSNAVWKVCSRESAAKFSAVGYYFGEALRRRTDVPLGFVYAPRGGTQMFMWVDAATAAASAELTEASKRSAKKHKMVGGDWNGKIAPLAGMSVKGIVWYQGESDSWNPMPSTAFGTMLETMIGFWRKSWGDAKLPFVVVQLPSMDARFWPRSREAQDAASRRLENVYLVNTIDTGWAWDVHPHDKTLVGERLAAVVERKVYGFADVALPPRFRSAEFAPGFAKVAFDADAKLAAKGAYERGFELKVGGAWTPAAGAAVEADGTVAVMAADAAAKVDGVRYLYEGWAKPDVWLVDAKGNPAFPFTSVPADKDQVLQARPCTLFFAGDSTLDDHGLNPKKAAYGSWGTTLRANLADGMRIVNYAKSGRSTLSFRREGWWDKILNEVRPGDYVLIEFGHNDQKLDKPDVAVPRPQFKANLTRMVGEVRARGAVALFATPIVRLTYEPGGKKLADPPNLDSWAQAMREVAWERSVRLVDLRKLGRAEAERVGEAEALTWNAPGDRTHPGPKGARLYADLFLKDIFARKLDFARMFKNPVPAR